METDLSQFLFGRDLLLSFGVYDFSHVSGTAVWMVMSVGPPPDEFSNITVTIGWIAMKL